MRCLRAWETFVTKMSPLGAQRCNLAKRGGHLHAQSGATQSMLPHTAGDMQVVDFFAPETLLTSYRAMSAEQSR